MSLNATYDLFAGILLIAQAAFIGAPAWSRWTRNLVLVREGIKTTGHYQGKTLVVFILEPDKQVTFSTWRRAVRISNIGDELPVLYHPANPYRAEVMTPAALWDQPLNSLVRAAAQTLTGVLPFQGTNLELALLLLFVEWLFGFPLAKFALYHLYPASRLHQFDGGEATPGPGRRHSRQQRRWQRQLDWKEQPHVPESEDLAVLTTQEISPAFPPKRRDRKDRLLLDMVDPLDTPEVK